MNVAAVAAVFVRPDICNRCALFTSVTIAMEEKERGRKTRTSSSCSAMGWMDLGSSCQLPNFFLLTPAPGVYPRSHTLNPSPTAGDSAATFLGPGPRAIARGAPRRREQGSEPPAKGGAGAGQEKEPISGRDCGRAAIGGPCGLQPWRPVLVL